MTTTSIRSTRQRLTIAVAALAAAGALVIAGSAAGTDAPVVKTAAAAAVT